MGREPGTGRSPRRVILGLALLATVANLLLVLPHAFDSREGAPLHLLFAGRDGPSAPVVEADFDERLVPGVGHDGQQFYAIARDPWHPQDTAEFLDKPVYRLQRPLLSWLGWALHPTGGGPGLAWALFAVNVAAVLLLGVAAGLLSTRLGGPSWPAFVVPMLPCSYYSLDFTLADSLALGLGLLAMWAFLDRRLRLAALAAVLAVLAKEVTIVYLIGLALWRRDRRGLVLVVPPLIVSGALRVVLEVTLPPDQAAAINYAGPFVGIWRSRHLWLDGREMIAAVSVLGSVAVAAAAFVRRRGLEHPLGWPIALQFLATIVLDAIAVAQDGNAARTAAPLFTLGLIALVSPGSTADLAPSMSKPEVQRTG